MYPTSKVKQDLLDEAARQGRTKFTRVSQTAVDQILAQTEASYRRILRGFVQSHPSIGVTLSANRRIE